MELKIKSAPKAEWETIQVDGIYDIEEIIHIYKEKTGAQPRFKYLAASVNNTLKELNTLIKEPCSIEFFDMRTQAGNQTYQNGLVFIYLAAVNKVLPGARVVIQNSLNKSLFTLINADEPVTDEQIVMIDEQMRDFINRDVPFEKYIVPKQDVKEYLKQKEMIQKLRIVRARGEVEFVKYYEMEGYINFFYNIMVPSAGYIEFFELQRYKEGIRVIYPDNWEPDKMQDYVPQLMLYEAFDEAEQWNQLMDVKYVVDLNAKIKFGGITELIEISEALHEKKVVEIANIISTLHKRIILIAGPSSSGKTTFARRLAIQLMVIGLKPLCLSTDDYFVDRENTPLDEYGERNYENLDAIDLELFNNNMNDLLAGKKVDLPKFDFITGQKVFGNNITEINKNQPIIIEGIHGLNEAMTRSIPKEEKFKIYVSPFTQLSIDEHNRIPTMEARMLRRMVRDYAKRDRSPQSTIREWPKVMEAEAVNIFPHIDGSDVVFNSVHIYELAVLKKLVVPLLEGIGDDEPEHVEAVRLLKILEFFKTIEDDTIIVNNSILREFIGGSIYESK